MGKLYALVGLLSLVVPTWAQKPSDADAAALIEKSRQESMAYARSLPDFVCTEVISRYRQDVILRNGAPTTVGGWLPLDKLTVKLNYSQQQEMHQLMLVNGKPTSLKYDSLYYGAITSGEFGGILKRIFDPASQTSFHWERWKDNRGRRVALFAFEVDAAHSNYYLERDLQHATVAYHGTLEIDPETGEVLHFDHVADHIPKRLALTSGVTAVDYRYVDISGQKYLLPAHSEAELSGPSLAQKNESEFREYRKFEASSSIDFGKGK